MNVERLTPEHIRNSAEPFDDMFGDLNDFANKIGGNSWRNDKSHKIGFERSISVCFDDEIGISSELSLPGFDGTDQAEDIAIRFNAEREMYDNGYLYTTYDIVYIHEIPVRLADIPTKYQEQFVEQLNDFNEDNDTQLEVDDMLNISEIHAHKYSVTEEDDSITYTEDVLYTWLDNIEVEGEMFHSVNKREVVHGQDVDDFAYELGQYDDQIESKSNDPETIIYDEKFAQMTDKNEDIGTLFHSEDDHARRIVALLSLLGSDLIN